MGTNYFLRHKIGNRQSDEEDLHIGKSSAGWCFALHVSEPDMISVLPKSLDGWKELFFDDSYIIVNEYDDVVDPDLMVTIISERSWNEQPESPPFGCSSWEEFYKENSCKTGPNNLFRHCVNEGHCIGHGNGSWDLIIGEFF